MRYFTLCRSIKALIGLAALLGATAFTAVSASTAVKAVAQEPAARCSSDEILLLRRPAPDKPWELVVRKDNLPPGELLVGGPGVALESANGAVRLSFLCELTGTSVHPVKETAIVLHKAKDVDLDFTLNRGRLDLVNLKKDGPARVRIRGGDRSAVVTLKGPGARFALELYGRWLPGTPFRKEPKAGEAPAYALVAIALKGEIDIKGPRRQVILKAPPGPALIQVSSLDDTDYTPIRLDKAPAWAEGKLTDEQKKVREAAVGFRRLVKEKSLGEAIDTLLKSEDPLLRRAAVNLMGATDDLERLGATLTKAKQWDVWDSGVLALRHWIGRGPGQDQKLYQALITRAKMPASQAETVMQLLHGLSEEDLDQPVIYQVLIRLLASDRLAIRGLAYWHLSRLVPAGKEFGYGPLESPEKRAAAIKRWQQLIPPGKLPKTKAGAS
jgi:hypothetical protein